LYLVATFVILFCTVSFIFFLFVIFVYRFLLEYFCSYFRCLLTPRWLEGNDENDERLQREQELEQQGQGKTPANTTSTAKKIGDFEASTDSEAGSFSSDNDDSSLDV
jgi:hypothetical protein